MNEKIKKQMTKHNAYLNDLACLDLDAIYLKEEKEDIRTSYFHDIDRIIYSLAFMRYQGKTQVFSYTTHNHISKRMIHVMFVSKIARTIGRALGLNEDLIEAASLGHDLGHAPFGHVGETILNEISLAHNEGYFNHNVHSVRILKDIENYGEGLNISVQVLDSIMCHNGEVTLGKYAPKNKTKAEFLQQYEQTYHEKDFILKLRPMTLEGCVVRISDVIAYIGRDIDDGIRTKLIKREDIPDTIRSVIGDNTRDIVNNCVLDIIENSNGHNYIKMSDKVNNAITELKNFNYKYIYNNSESGKLIDNLRVQFNTLFDTYIEDIKNNNINSPIIYSYLNNMSLNYRANNTKERIILDYIAGMTDDYFTSEFMRISNNTKENH